MYRNVVTEMSRAETAQTETTRPKRPVPYTHICAYWIAAGKTWQMILFTDNCEAFFLDFERRAT